MKVRCKVCAPTTLSEDLGCRMLAAKPKPFRDIIGAAQLVYGWEMLMCRCQKVDRGENERDEFQKDLWARSVAYTQ